MPSSDTAGEHKVALEVIDDNGASSVATAIVAIGEDGVATVTPVTATDTAAPPPPTPEKIGATLRYKFIRSASATMFTSLLVRNVPVGAKVKARCTGGGCVRKTYTAIARTGSVSLRTMIRRKLKVGAAITIVVSKPGMISRTMTVTVQKGKDPKFAGK
jgi:hypothetical protein